MCNWYISYHQLNVIETSHSLERMFTCPNINKIDTLNKTSNPMDVSKLKFFQQILYNIKNSGGALY